MVRRYCQAESGFYSQWQKVRAWSGTMLKLLFSPCSQVKGRLWLNAAPTDVIFRQATLFMDLVERSSLFPLMCAGCRSQAVRFRLSKVCEEQPSCLAVA